MLASAINRGERALIKSLEEAVKPVTRYKVSATVTRGLHLKAKREECILRVNLCTSGLARINGSE